MCQICENRQFHIKVIVSYKKDRLWLMWETNHLAELKIIKLKPGQIFHDNKKPLGQLRRNYGGSLTCPTITSRLRTVAYKLSERLLYATHPPV